METERDMPVAGAASRPVGVAVWAAQGLVGTLLVGGGLWKLLTPRDELAEVFAWVGEVPAALVVGTSVLDVVGGLGLLLPSLTRIRPWLAVAAAVGVIALQVSAIVFHVSRGEGGDIAFNLLVIALTAFVAWGRAVRVPVAAR